MSKVYFTSMRTENGITLQKKLEKLIKTAGIEQIDFADKFTAIKLHFGERGNLAFLRPNYARTVADLVSQKGGKPFLTDCNTLYVGGRKNAPDHLETASLNGFTPYTVGCHVIIADGLRGNDETLIPVKGGEFVKEAKIGSAIAEADIIISMNHFKGHELTGMGGAIKNLGMGCGSTGGKQEMHSAGKPYVNAKCVGCGKCTLICAHSAISVSDRKASIDHGKCVGCGRCIAVCPAKAIRAAWDESNEILCKKIAEYAWAVLDGKQNFHINFVVDVSPNCDCHSENDMPIVSDVGIFASFDPVALDMACADAVNKQPVLAGSLLSECPDKHSDHFTNVHPETNWKPAVTHAAKLGMGSVEYEIIDVK